LFALKEGEERREERRRGGEERKINFIFTF